MPRKPKLPPQILRVESLSTGLELKPERLVDELGEGSFATIPDQRKAKPLPTGAQVQDAGNRAKLNYHKAVLILAKRGDLVGYKPEPVPVIATDRMLIGTFKDAKGNEYAITKPKPPFRRI